MKILHTKSFLSSAYTIFFVVPFWLGIKYVKAGVVNHTGSSHIGIPIIDPLIGQDYNSTGTNRQNHHQRQLFTQLHQHARLLVNKNIFHWHQQTHHHQWWWDSSTPPSSVDLEWEHEGMLYFTIERAFFHDPFYSVMDP